MIGEDELVNQVIEKIESMEELALVNLYNTLFGTALTVDAVKWNENGADDDQH